MGSNLRSALRLWTRTPGLSAVAVATLALGIGVNASVFSLVRGILLRVPAFAQPERVVALWEKSSKQGYDANPPSAPDFDDWRRETRSFDRLALVDAQRLGCRSSPADRSRRRGRRPGAARVPNRSAASAQERMRKRG